MRLEKIEIGKLIPAEYNPRKDLKPGDKVKVFIDESARHFGMAIDETIIEK